MRKIISISAIAFGLLFLLAGAGEADYDAETYVVGYRWLQYLLTGFCLLIGGLIVGRQ